MRKRDILGDIQHSRKGSISYNFPQGGTLVGNWSPCIKHSWYCEFPKFPQFHGWERDIMCLFPNLGNWAFSAVQNTEVLQKLVNNSQSKLQGENSENSKQLNYLPHSFSEAGRQCNDPWHWCKGWLFSILTLSSFWKLSTNSSGCQTWNFYITSF